MIIGETQYLFYESYDRQVDQRYLLCRTLDSNATLSEVKVMEVLDSRRRARGDFDIQLSKDRSKIAIFTNPPYERNSTENSTTSLMPLSSVTLMSLYSRSRLLTMVMLGLLS